MEKINKQDIDPITGMDVDSFNREQDELKYQRNLKKMTESQSRNEAKVAERQQLNAEKEAKRKFNMALGKKAVAAVLAALMATGIIAQQVARDKAVSRHIEQQLEEWEQEKEEWHLEEARKYQRHQEELAAIEEANKQHVQEIIDNRPPLETLMNVDITGEPDPDPNLTPPEPGDLP